MWKRTRAKDEDLCEANDRALPSPCLPECHRSNWLHRLCACTSVHVRVDGDRLDRLRSLWHCSHLHIASQHLSCLPRSQASTVHTAAHFYASHMHIKRECQCHLEFQPIYFCLCLVYVSTNHSAMHAICNYYHFCHSLIYRLCGYFKPGLKWMAVLANKATTRGCDN